MDDRNKSVHAHASLLAVAALLTASSAAAALSISWTASVDPPQVIGGTSARVTVVLARPATSEFTVALTSSAPDVASVPATVTVPGGSLSFSYLVRTTSV